MDITATEFLKQAITTAEHFGFAPVDTLKKRGTLIEEPTKLRHVSSANERKNDALHGLLTGGVVSYSDNQLHNFEEPALFYTIEQVPRSGDTALSLQVFGVPKSIAEAVLIQTTRAIARDMHGDNHTVRINSMGDKDSSARYARELTNFMKKRLDDMPVTARELMKEHVFTALMHLIEKEDELAYKSPNPMEYLSDPSRKHFREIVEYLDMSETPYEIDPKLIGHHQCYSDALFAIDLLDENDLPLEDAPIYIRGGRYNTFSEKHLRQDIPAAGAVVVLRDKKAPARIPKSILPDNSAVYVVQLGFGPKITTLLLIDELRKAGIAVQQNITSDSLGTQLRDAEAKGVRFSVIVGQKEFVENAAILRDMKARTQETIDTKDLITRLKRSRLVASA